MGTQSDFLVGLVQSVGNMDFETVYQTELPRIYNFFRYRVGDDHIAEDLTAETFEKAWKHRERYRDDLASFSTWLFIIARRLPGGSRGASPSSNSGGRGTGES